MLTRTMRPGFTCALAILAIVPWTPVREKPDDDVVTGANNRAPSAASTSSHR